MSKGRVDKATKFLLKLLFFVFDQNTSHNYNNLECCSLFIPEPRSICIYFTKKFTPEAKNLIISPHYRPFTLCEKNKAIGKNVYAWRLTFAGGDESVVFNEVEFVVFVASVDIVIDSK